MVTRREVNLVIDPSGLKFGSVRLITLVHPAAAAGRVYAACGGVYVFMAILWLWAIDCIRPTTWDMVGASVALLGMSIIMFAPRAT